MKPRLCLGKPLAYLEMKLTMAFLIQRFDLTQFPNEVHSKEYLPSIATAPKGQVLVRPKIRVSVLSKE